MEVMAKRNPSWVLVLAAAAGSLGAGEPARPGVSAAGAERGDGDLRAHDLRGFETRPDSAAARTAQHRPRSASRPEDPRRADAGRADLGERAQASSRRERAAEAYPRYEELSRRGSAAATLWCLEYLDAVSAPDPRASGSEGGARRVELYRRLIDQTGDDRVSARDALARLVADARELGADVAVEIARELGLRAADDEIRAGALVARARILVEIEHDVERARALYDEVLARYGKTAAAGDARNGCWRLEHLAIGSVAPDFTTYDAFGNELRLSDFRGQVTVVRFWSADDRDCAAERAHERRLAARLWDERFVLLGINADPDRGAFLGRCDELEISWPTGWEGESSGRTARDWRVDRRSATYVLDAEGIVRFVDVTGPDLDRAVDLLVQEMRDAAARDRASSLVRGAEGSFSAREERSLPRSR